MRVIRRNRRRRFHAELTMVLQDCRDFGEEVWWVSTTASDPLDPCANEAVYNRYRYPIHAIFHPLREVNQRTEIYQGFSDITEGSVLCIFPGNVPFVPTLSDHCEREFEGHYDVVKINALKFSKHPVYWECLLCLKGGFANVTPA